MPLDKNDAALWADLASVIARHRPAFAKEPDPFELARLMGVALGYAVCKSPYPFQALEGLGNAVGEWVVVANSGRDAASISSALDVTLEYIERAAKERSRIGH